ncbi:serine/threonine-protein kinase [Streptomyces morookaense]|uniref:serine/threonine-protein kinase n=1 Tax=Streptomyces morookaense TaxID=1970 RepID=UPI001E537882|nr:serine/threonine-protein kinase [Streptomyces morookaense]
MVGRYRLLELIGRGGMGRVWCATDEMLDRRVAAKEIRIDGLMGEGSAVQRERSRREARATARIDHPNVVRVYDVAEENDRLWIVMELVDGRSLEQVLRRDGPVEPREAARIGLALVRALREVHAVGVLHRDIKPGNVLLTARGRVVLTDFGIAAVQDAAALTMAGTLVGSPDYMAPERIEGREQGPPSDLWSLGATLCAAVAGQSPFTRGTTLATLHAVLYEEPEIPQEAGPLRELLSGLLLKDPGGRPALDGVEEILAAVCAPPPPEPVPHPPTEVTAPPPLPPAPEAPPEPAQDERPPRPRPYRRSALLAATAAVAAAVVAGAVFLALQGAPGGGGGSTGAGSPSASPSDARRTEDGFSWAPPADWNRTEKSPSDISYAAKDGTIEISASQARTTEDVVTHWQRDEENFHGITGYRKIRLDPTTFRGNSAVIWEYTIPQAGTPWYGRQLGFEKGGRTYQVNVWYQDSAEKAALDVYARVKASFRTG